MKKKILLSALVLFLFSGLLYADSPLTSTDFWKAYSQNEKVQKARQYNGMLSDECFGLLDNNSIAIDIRLAVINALGWDFNGKSNFDFFLNYLIKKHRRITKRNYKKRCSADELICLAYIKAMDNYFMVDDALSLAKLAIKKDRTNSFSIHIIYGLIKAQYYFNSNWCKTFMATDDVRNDKKLVQDMKPQAVKIIFNYMDLYKSDCK